MDKKLKSIGIYMVASALIWGLVIIGCSFALKGTECYSKIQNILVGGVLIHIFFIWAPLAMLFKKVREQKS